MLMLGGDVWGAPESLRAEQRVWHALQVEAVGLIPVFGKHIDDVLWNGPIKQFHAAQPCRRVEGNHGRRFPNWKRRLLHSSQFLSPIPLRYAGSCVRDDHAERRTQGSRVLLR